MLVILSLDLAAIIDKMRCTEAWSARILVGADKRQNPFTFSKATAALVGYSTLMALNSESLYVEIS